MRFLIALLVVFAGLAACGNGGKQAATEEQSKTASAADTEKAQKRYPTRPFVDKSQGEDTVTVTIHTPGDNLGNMRYDLDTLKIRAGQTVKLTLVNTAPKGAEEMEHNWVVTKPGKDQMVASKGVKAGEANNFLPENKQHILAYTPIVKQQKRVSITFSIDQSGTFPFICTHPKHYPAMKGTLIVRGKSS